MTVVSHHPQEESGAKRYGGAVLREGELQAGAVVAGGAYRIDFVLGRGGMATVYAATRTSDQLRVAVKVLDAKFAQRSDADYRMSNELTLPAELAGHPNIASPIDAGRLPELADAPFLVTEWVQGQDLTLLVVGERRLAPARACRLALDIAHGLAALHHRGIVHRDIKPDNIIVVPAIRGPECAKLIDFGLVARVPSDPAAPRVTSAWERPGTQLYMAPEQALGAAPSPSFDVYALGLTMHLMLTGFAPLTGVAGKELLELKVSKPITIRDARDDLPFELSALVDECLRIKPSERVTIVEVCDRLRRLVEVLERGEEQVVAGTIELAVLAPRPEPAVVLASTMAEPVQPFAESQRPIIEVRPSTRAPGPPTALKSRWLPWAIVASFLVALGVYVLRAGREPTGAGAAEPRASAVAADGAPEPAVVPTNPVASDERALPPVAAPSARTPSSSIGPAVAETAPPPAVETPRPRERPRAKPQPSTAAHESEACVAARSAAVLAESNRDWRAVLEHTKAKRCWPELASRLRSRLRALSALGDYATCVREGAGSQEKIVALCRAKLEER